MLDGDDPAGGTGLTRTELLRLLAGGGAAAAGGAALGAASRGDDPLAATAEGVEEDILQVFLVLEDVQEAFYHQAADAQSLDAPSVAFARTVRDQERRHVAFLERNVRGRRRERPAARFDDALRSTEAFQAAAIDLEEAAIAAYIGQGARLTGRRLRAMGTLLSVEARQAAWVRDLAGRNPAPRAADPPADAQEVLSGLRRRGFLA